MGACPKCGKPRVRKNPRGQRRCARCGVLLSGAFLDRAGQATRPTIQPALVPALAALLATATRGAAPEAKAAAQRLKVKWRSGATTPATTEEATA